jgi:hypothetical protein
MLSELEISAKSKIFKMKATAFVGILPSLLWYP